MKKYPILLLLVCVAIQGLSAQETEKDSLKISFGAYVEPYLNLDFNKPSSGNRPDFLYAYNRANEVNINLGMVKAKLESNRVRANVALAAGTYMNANYAAETGVMRNVQEMNVGLRLCKKQELWLDAGVMGSHIGFESAIGKDCGTLSRSMMAENSPYFETGAKLTYNTPNEKWLLSALVLNGWQRIQREEGNTMPSFGTQIQFSPNDKVLLNSSTFIGSDSPDAQRQMRYFHNFYGIFQLSDRWELTAAFDAGWEQVAPERSDYYTWYSSVLLLRYAATQKLSVAGRAEVYSDEEGVIMGINSFNVTGFSMNLDYAITPNALFRLEGRLLTSDNDIFQKDSNRFSKNNTCISAAIAVDF